MGFPNVTGLNVLVVCVQTHSLANAHLITPANMYHSLNSLQGSYLVDYYQGMKGDTRRLDYSSCSSCYIVRGVDFIFYCWQCFEAGTLTHQRIWEQ